MPELGCHHGSSDQPRTSPRGAPACGACVAQWLRRRISAARWPPARPPPRESRSTDAAGVPLDSTTSGCALHSRLTTKSTSIGRADALISTLSASVDGTRSVANSHHASFQERAIAHQARLGAGYPGRYGSVGSRPRDGEPRATPRVMDGSSQGTRNAAKCMFSAMYARINGREKMSICCPNASRRGRSGKYRVEGSGLLWGCASNEGGGG